LRQTPSRKRLLISRSRVQAPGGRDSTSHHDDRLVTAGAVFLATAAAPDAWRKESEEKLIWKSWSVEKPFINPSSYEPEGRQFDSVRAHHKINGLAGSAQLNLSSISDSVPPSNAASPASS